MNVLHNCIKKIIDSRYYLYLFSLFFASSFLFAQDYDYEFTIKPRRAFDQIILEFWAKSLKANTAPLGNASLVLQYNTSFFAPAQSQSLIATDSIAKFDANSPNPVITIHSNFDNANGYSPLAATSYSNGFFSLEITHNILGSLGLAPDTAGRGSFLGKIALTIIGNPTETDLANIKWSTSSFPGELRVFDRDGNDIKSLINFIDPDPNFTVIGVSFLSPNFEKMVVDIDENYLFLTGDYAQGGYPIYFERSVNPNSYSAPTGKPLFVDENLAYLFEYSLDNGETWLELGRATETEKNASTITKPSVVANYKSGRLFEPKGNNYVISSLNGEQINTETYRKPLRVILEKNKYFNYRSEESRLKISILEGTSTTPIVNRLPSDIYDINASKLVLGRLFFLQLNGTTNYLKTVDNFSNSTQLTVAAWINLNAVTGVVGAEPAIVASSGGPDATSTFGSNEGAWMLYLKDGNIPAFRAREILNRGDAGTENYIGICEAYSNDVLTPVSAAEPLSKEHSKNWVHIAATVKNNVISLFVNGELVSQVTNDNANDIRMLVTEHPIWIGVNPNGTVTADRFLAAGIKGVQVWRTALTQSEIRAFAPGIPYPDSIASYSDIKKGLELYYSFEGKAIDLASNKIYQNGVNDIIFYQDNLSTPAENTTAMIEPFFIDNITSVATYRPDQPHIKISSPRKNSGVLNKQGDNFVLRWVSYGLGDILKTSSNDLEIEYSLDKGESWFKARNPKGEELSGKNSPDAESGEAIWQPYQNNNPEANLRTIEPYVKNAILRIRGTEANEQSLLYSVTDEFQIAPYFGLTSVEGTILQVAPKEGMNINGDYAYFEAWIRPYRFPTDAEVYLPLIEKTARGVDGKVHYSLRLHTDGTLSLMLEDKFGNWHTARTSKNHVIIRPNSIQNDSLWTHIGVLFIKSNDKGISEARFYIDGVVEGADKTALNFKEKIELNGLNEYPLFIGYKPPNLLESARSFVGEFKEIRFWSGIPNNLDITGVEPTPFTVFVQSAQASPTSDLLNSNKINLHSSFSMDGGAFVIDGVSRAVAKSENNGILLKNYGEAVKFSPFKPFIKLVEPAFRQSVANTETDVRVRWVGLYYDGMNFTPGAKSEPPSIEYSFRGGGGNIIQPYQYVGSLYWPGNKFGAIKMAQGNRYLSKLTGKDNYIALSLDASIADPDLNNDGVFNDQGPLSPSLTNARFRLSGSFTINGETKKILSEGPLFTITPTHNFTVRVMLEGYHNGAYPGKLTNNISTSFAQGGLRVKLFRNNSGEIGAVVGEPAESYLGYADRDPANLYKGKMNFANANFVFTNVTDGNYWLLVEHINHLPIMSRYPAPFLFTGDVPTTLEVESGWDFLSWNGVDYNVMSKPELTPWSGNYFTARGTAVNSKTDMDRYATTGLIYNGGASVASNGLAAMVGGDVNQDKMINAADRVIVRQDVGIISPRSDVTGDKYVNAIDRTIVDRNYGKISSIYNINVPATIRRDLDEINVMDYVAEEDVHLSHYFNTMAKFANKNEKTIKDKKKNSLLAVSYEVMAEPTFFEDGKVELAFYILNTGEDFAPANCTFAISYDPNLLTFTELKGQEKVLFNSTFDFKNIDAHKPENGYLKLQSAPLDKNTQSNTRSIEIDYDAYANIGGINLPAEKTYLGTLCFKINKNQGVVVFNWHDSKAVLTTKGYNVTEYGNWQVIPHTPLYSVNIVSPNGGEKYAQKTKQTITWTTTNSANIFLEFSHNGGVTWRRLNDSAISSDLETFFWTTPDHTSSACLVRIIDAETGVEVDRSDKFFEIVAPYGYILNPYAASEPYRSNDKSFIEWYVEGASCVKFEFSDDGGITWQAINGKYPITTNKTNWVVPSVTTVTAVIRMLNCENDLEIARTGYFKILNGVLVITAPKLRELLYSNRTYKVRWTHKNIDKFDLDLSVDGGKNWTRVATNVIAKDNYINWIVPDIETENAIFRALYNSDETMEYCRSKMFRIRGDKSIGEVLPEGYDINDPTPNPATNSLAHMKINLPENIYLNISLIDLAGREIKTFYAKEFEAGSYAIDIDLSGVENGKYFILIKSKLFTTIREILISR
ncbi:MAG: LamG-like jellyroll fold domain-containing protein [Candidatus Kapaibacterium sp.]|jgi:hypothetical protein